MAEEREAGGPLCIIAMSFSFLVSVPILETVRLNLFQETLLSAPHLVGMFPAVKKRRNKLCLQQHPTAFYRRNQEILKGVTGLVGKHGEYGTAIIPVFFK